MLRMRRERGCGQPARRPASMCAPCSAGSRMPGGNCAVVTPGRTWFGPRQHA
eukprot:gene5625-7183_t